MNNLDQPAMALGEDAWVNSRNPALGTYRPNGFTKREQACLTMGVAATGCAELDAIIEQGNKQKLAGLAMQALVNHYGNDAHHDYAIAHANDVLQQLKGDV